MIIATPFESDEPLKSRKLAKLTVPWACGEAAREAFAFGVLFVGALVVSRVKELVCASSHTQDHLVW
jgi:hypothetical protein